MLDKEKIKAIIEKINLDKLYPDNQAIPEYKDTKFNQQAIFRVFILMVLTDTHSIKGIWKYLSQNSDLLSSCGLDSLPDRSTISRRLDKLNVKEWIK